MEHLKREKEADYADLVQQFQSLGESENEKIAEC